MVRQMGKKRLAVHTVTDTTSRVDKTGWVLQLRQTVFRWDQWVTRERVKLEELFLKLTGGVHAKELAAVLGDR